MPHVILNPHCKGCCRICDTVACHFFRQYFRIYLATEHLYQLFCSHACSQHVCSAQIDSAADRKPSVYLCSQKRRRHKRVAGSRRQPYRNPVLSSAEYRIRTHLKKIPQVQMHIDKTRHNDKTFTVDDPVSLFRHDRSPLLADPAVLDHQVSFLFRLIPRICNTAAS